MLLAEAAVVHLLLPREWLWVHLALAVVHLYCLLWLFAWAAGPRLCPHRVTAGCLLVRGGVLYESRVPLDAVAGAVVRRRRVPGEAGLVIDRGAVLLPARRSVDLWLELARPVTVARPLGEAVSTRRLAIAADDPERLAALLTRGDVSSLAPSRAPRVPGLLALPGLVYGSE
jgi:hypothetical protein